MRNAISSRWQRRTSSLVHCLTPMIEYQAAFAAVQKDPRYLENLDWGKPRRGHPEGTVRAHIAEVQGNLDRLRSRLSETDYWRAMLLVHTHDTFKSHAKPGVPISDPRSHASLGRAFLAEFTNDSDLLAMVQYHDEPYALWRQWKEKGVCNRLRWEALLGNIQDWNLFLAFCLADGCTEGKGREPLLWLFVEAEGKVRSSFNANDIL
jgi:hypothetical protein